MEQTADVVSRELQLHELGYIFGPYKLVNEQLDVRASRGLVLLPWLVQAHFAARKVLGVDGTLILNFARLEKANLNLIFQYLLAWLSKRSRLSFGSL